MLFVHFTPKKNLSNIQKNGLHRAGRGIYLFPLVHDLKTLVNNWNSPHFWTPGTVRHDQSMAKVIVRLPKTSRVAFGTWDLTPRFNGLDAYLDLNHPTFSVAALGRLLACDVPNPFRTSAKLKGWTQEDRAALIEFFKTYALRDKEPGKDAARKFDEWMKREARRLGAAVIPEWESDEKDTPCYLWQDQVVYPRRISPHWIVNILDRSNTDARSRAYARKKEAKVLAED